MRNKHGSNVMF